MYGGPGVCNGWRDVGCDGEWCKVELAARPGDVKGGGWWNSLWVGERRLNDECPRCALFPAVIMSRRWLCLSRSSSSPPGRCSTVERKLLSMMAMLGWLVEVEQGTASTKSPLRLGAQGEEGRRT
jgi:hypothetical protein